MNTVIFSNIKRYGTTLQFDIASSKRDAVDTITFDIAPYKAKDISNNAIACVMATLVGKGYDNVCVMLPLGDSVVSELKKFTNAEWSAEHYRKPFILLDKIGGRIQKNKNEKLILNFSGGFDSLAAKAIMPETTELVSVDFGGWFTRETKFFSTFSTHIIKTNFRELMYDRESWTFMGIGALLLADVLKAKYVTFGTILEASFYNFRKLDMKKRWYTMPFSILGLEEAHIIRGITEVGTAIIVSYYYPDLVNASLESLAADGSEKKCRKQQLMSIVCKKFDRNIDIQNVKAPNPEQRNVWGTNFATDFLALYEIKYGGIDIAKMTIETIPVEAVELVTELSLNFFERISKEYIDIIPEDIQTYVTGKLLESGIKIYDENDYREISIVVKFMRKYYPNL